LTRALSLSQRWDSNPRPIAYEAIALPAELRWQKKGIQAVFLFDKNQIPDYTEFMNIIMYTKRGCPWCDDARTLLVEKHVIFEEREVTENSGFFQELVDLSGQSKTPTFNIDGDIFADSSAEEIAPILRERGLLGF
jgi:glutaredoxin 3